MQPPIDKKYSSVIKQLRQISTSVYLHRLYAIEATSEGQELPKRSLGMLFGPSFQYTVALLCARGT